MITQVYSVLDVKARAFGALLFFVNDDMCRRGMFEAMQSPSDFTKWPSDFVMYRVGAFETDDGMLTGILPQVIASFDEFARKEG